MHGGFMSKQELLAAFRAGDGAAIARFAESLPSLKGLEPQQARRRAVALHDAQSVIAREYGFASWSKLIDHVEEIRSRGGVTPEAVERFIEAALTDRRQALGRVLELYPGITKFDHVCALIGGEAELVQRWIDADPARVARPVGPKKWLPLEYVCHSRMHWIEADRSERLLRCAQALLDRGADANTSHVDGHDSGAPLSVLYGAAGATGHLGLVRLL